MRVAHVAAPSAFGGLESVVLDLTRGLVERGVESCLWLVTEPAAGSSELAERAGGAGVKVREVTVPARAYLTERRKLRELCAELEIDVLHTHGYRPDIVAGPVGRKLGIPVVTTVHGFTGGDLRNRFYEWLQRRAFRKMDAVVAVSARLEAELQRAGIPRAKLHMIRNAWERRDDALDRSAARQVLGLGDDRRVVGWVGRASREKGLDVALAALSLLDLPDVTLAVVGDGPELVYLRERYRNLESAGRLVWCGARERGYRLFSAFDVFLLSSHTEGTPVVIFEAMGAGTPIVATMVGGVPDVVSDSEAILVKPGDPAAIAAALGTVLTQPKLAAGIAEAASARLASFGYEGWTTAYSRLYADLLAAG